MSAKELNKLLKEIQKKMHQAAAELNFEEAAVLRDRILEGKKHYWIWNPENRQFDKNILLLTKFSIRGIFFYTEEL